MTETSFQKMEMDEEFPEKTKEDLKRTKCKLRLFNTLLKNELELKGNGPHIRFVQIDTEFKDILISSKNLIDELLNSMEATKQADEFSSSSIVRDIKGRNLRAPDSGISTCSSASSLPVVSSASSMPELRINSLALSELQESSEPGIQASEHVDTSEDNDVEDVLDIKTK